MDPKMEPQDKRLFSIKIEWLKLSRNVYIDLISQFPHWDHFHSLPPSKIPKVIIPKYSNFLIISYFIFEKLFFFSVNNSFLILCSNNKVFIKDLICSKTQLLTVGKMYEYCGSDSHLMFSSLHIGTRGGVVYIWFNCVGNVWLKKKDYFARIFWEEVSPAPFKFYGFRIICRLWNKLYMLWEIQVLSYKGRFQKQPWGPSVLLNQPLPPPLKVKWTSTNVPHLKMAIVVETPHIFG